MISDNKYLFRASDIYYINDQDFYHYRDTEGQTKKIKLSTRGQRHQTQDDTANRGAVMEQQSLDITGIPGNTTDI